MTAEKKRLVLVLPSKFLPSPGPIPLLSPSGILMAFTFVLMRWGWHLLVTPSRCIWKPLWVHKGFWSGFNSLIVSTNRSDTSDAYTYTHRFTQPKITLFWVQFCCLDWLKVEPLPSPVLVLALWWI